MSTATSAGYVSADYLKALAQAAEPIKKRIRDLLALGSNSKILDAGCGPGTDTIPLARLLNNSGIICGMDADRSMIQAAQTRIQVEWFQNLYHYVANATAIPCKTNSFDAAFCDRVLQHIKDAHNAVAEMCRIVKPGGKIVLVDSDHSSLSISTNNSSTECALRTWRTQRLHNGLAARNLGTYAIKAGLLLESIECIPFLSRSYAGFRLGTAADLVEQEAVTRGIISSDQLDSYKSDLEDLDRANAFYSVIPMIILSATKP